MKQAHIALLTDFGTTDHYVAAVKGVILSTVPGIGFTDISHDIPRHNVSAAAYTLHCVASFFPAGTIFLCIVDPGVGTDRRILCLKLDGRIFIGPDNGLLNRFAEQPREGQWFVLKPQLRGSAVSATFQGRDIMAPAVARIATGGRVTSIASPIPPPPAIRLFEDIPRSGGEIVRGLILHVDHFGNIITNLRITRRLGYPLTVKIGKSNITRLHTAYATGSDKQPFLIPGSSGLLEISVNRGSAADLLKVKAGDALRLRT